MTLLPLLLRLLAPLPLLPLLLRLLPPLLLLPLLLLPLLLLPLLLRLLLPLLLRLLPRLLLRLLAPLLLAGLLCQAPPLPQLRLRLRCLPPLLAPLRLRGLHMPPLLQLLLLLPPLLLQQSSLLLLPLLPLIRQACRAPHSIHCWALPRSSARSAWRRLPAGVQRLPNGALLLLLLPLLLLLRLLLLLLLLLLRWRLLLLLRWQRTGLLQRLGQRGRICFTRLRQGDLPRLLLLLCWCQRCQRPGGRLLLLLLLRWRRRLRPCNCRLVGSRPGQGCRGGGHFTSAKVRGGGTATCRRAWIRKALLRRGSGTCRCGARRCTKLLLRGRQPAVHAAAAQPRGDAAGDARRARCWTAEWPQAGLFLHAGLDLADERVQPAEPLRQRHDLGVDGERR